MILINLLPHREERRQRQQAAFYAGIGLSVGVGVLIALAWYAALGHMARAQGARNLFLSPVAFKLLNLYGLLSVLLSMGLCIWAWRNFCSSTRPPMPPWTPRCAWRR